MPLDLEEFERRRKALKAQLEQTGDKDPRNPEAEAPKLGGGYSLDNYTPVSDEDLHPNRDIENEAIYNTLHEKRLINRHGSDENPDELDDATWLDKLFNQDTDGKLVRKTASVNSRGPLSDYSATGKEAQESRHKLESMYGWLPFLGRGLSYSVEENGYYPYLDSNGKYYLKEVRGTEDELDKANRAVLSAYGPKPFSNNFATAFAKGLANSSNSTVESLYNFGELTTDLGEATANLLSGKGFKSEEGATDKIAAEERAKNRIRNNQLSYNAGGPLDSAEGLASGIGSGVSSLAQFMLTGGAITGVASAVSNAPKAIRAAQTLGMLGAGAILNTGEAYTVAKQNGLSEEASAALALATGAVNTAIENKFGSNLLQKWLVSSKTAAREIPEIILRETGGDLSEATLNKATTSIIAKASKTINNFTKTPIVGQAFEEGAEEAAQNLAMKTGQWLYDRFAPEGATKGHGKFGAEFDKDTFRDAFADAAVGAIVGGLGGAVMGKHNSNEQNIYPLITSGKTDQILASVDMLHNSGKINDSQREAYKTRVTNLDNLWNKNSKAFTELGAKAPELQAQALKAIEDEFQSHRTINRYLDDIASIKADNSISDAVKEQQVNELNEKIEKERGNLVSKTARVREFMPNSEGKIPAVDNAKADKNTAETLKENHAVKKQQEQDILEKQSKEKEIEQLKAEPNKTKEQETRLSELERDTYTYRGKKYIMRDYEDEIHLVPLKPDTTKQGVESAIIFTPKLFQKELSSGRLKKDKLTPIEPSTKEATTSKPSEVSPDNNPENLFTFKPKVKTTKVPEPIVEPKPELGKALWNAKHYNRMKTFYEGHPEEKALNKAHEDWQEALRTGDASGKIVVKKDKANYDIYASINGKPVKIGYLPATEGKADIYPEADELTKAAHKQMRELKAAIDKLGIDNIELDYDLLTRIDSGPSVEYTGKTLAELDNRFQFEKGKYVIYRKAKPEPDIYPKIKQEFEAILGKFTAEDEKLSDKVTNRYILKVKDPQGRTRFIGLNNKPANIADINSLVPIMNDPTLTDKDKANQLNSKIFIASKDERLNTKFVVNKGEVYITVNENKTDSPRGSIAIGKNNGSYGPYNSMQAFLDSMKPKSKSKKDTRVEDIVSSFRLQLPADATEDQILDLLIPSTTEALWGKVSLRINGLKNSDPVESTTKAVTDTVKVTDEPVKASKQELLKGVLTKEEAFKKDEDGPSDELVFKLSTNSKLYSTNWKQVEANIARILPQFFTIHNLRDLASSVYNTGSTMGAFIDNSIYLADNIEKGTEYHEAFHAVFRKLIPAVEANKLLVQAKKHIKITNHGIALFRSQRGYTNQSEDEIKNLMAEEYLADRFQDYMNNKPETIFEKVFAAIKQFINWISSNRDDIKDFFASVDRGAFVNFPTPNQEAIGARFELFSTLPKTGVRESARIINILTAIYIDRKSDLIKNKEGSTYYQQYKDLSDTEVIKNLIDERKAYESFTESQVLDIAKNPEDLKELGLYEDKGKYYKAAYNFPEDIVKLVKSRLKYFRRNTEIDNFLEENESNEVADRNYDLSPFEYGGTGSLNRDIREFIELTLYKDAQGNDQIIDFFNVYSALERTLSGVRSWDELITKLDKLAQGSVQIRAVSNKLASQSSNFKTSFQQSFSKMKVIYKQITYNPSNNSSELFNANRQDIGDIQLSKFKAQFDRLSPSEQKDIAKQVAEVNNSLSRVSMVSAEEYASKLSALGFDFTKEFIQDVINNTNEDFGIKKSNDKPGLTSSISEIISSILSDKNPFVETKEGGNVSRIKALAIADSKFRDDIINTNFQNAEGKSQYTYITPLFILRKAEDIMRGVLSGDKFTELNPIVQLSKTSKDLLKNLEVSIFSGIRDTTSDDGTTFKHIDPKTLIVSQHSAYRKGYINPFVFETKSASMFLKIPSVGKLYENKNITPIAMKYIKNFIEQDKLMYEQSLKDIVELADDQLIEGYHFKGYINNKPNRITKEFIEKEISEGRRSKLPRGFQIVQFPFLNKYSNEQLTEEVIDREISNFLKANIKAYRDLLDTYEINPRLVIPSDVVKEAGDIHDYLGEFLLTDFIFTNAYSQLIRGNEAKYKDGIDITKRAAALVGPGYPLILTEAKYTAALIQDDYIYLDPNTLERVDSKHPNAKPVNSTDAQGYISPKRFKDVLKGLGRLSGANEELIDKLIAGEDIEWNPKIEGIFTANSIKNVYFDGEVYIKTSVIPLFKQFTSIKHNGKWEAKPGLEYYHELRQKMEGEHNGVRASDLPEIGELYHESAFKLVKRAKNLRDGSGQLPYRLATQELDNSFWKLQVENPSGKTKITDGTQLIELIDSELPDSDIVNLDGKEVSIADLRKEYNNLLASIRQHDMVDAVKQLDELTPDGKAVFIDKIRTTLENSGADNNTINFFEQAAKHSTEFKYSTDLPNINKKFQQIFFAHFSKNVFSQKVPGGKYTLVSAAGYNIYDEKLGKYRPLAIHKTGNYQYAEAVISEDLLLNYGLTRASFEKLPQANQQEILTMLGYRIPTQSHHSMIPFRVVDWLPAYYGSTIIVPSEVVYLSGADYDVDALYIHRKDFQVKTGKVYKDIESEDPEERKSAMNNRILDLRLAFLKAPSIAKSQLEPATSDRLADIAGIVGTTEVTENPYNWNTSRFSNWRNNAVGKNNIGIAAMSTKTSAALTKLKAYLVDPIIGDPISLFFDNKEFTGYESNEEEDITLLNSEGKLTLGDRQVNRKADSMSNILSAMADNAKDRLAAKLNLTQYNLGVFCHMISLGMGLNRTMLFANQPVLKTLSHRQEAANSTIDPTGKSWNVVGNLHREISEVLKESRIERTPDVTSEEMLANLGYDFEDLLYKKDKNEEDYTKLQKQLAILDLYSQLEDLGDSFRNFGAVLSLDKSVGSSFDDFDKLSEAWSNVKTIAIDIKKNARIRQNLAYLNYINSELLPRYFMSRTPAFQKMVENMKNLGVNSRDLSKLHSDLVIFFWMQRLNKLMKSSQGGDFTKFQGLLDDPENNIVSKYKKVFAKIPRNSFLRQLIAKDPDDNSPFYRLEFNSRIKSDPLFIEKLVDSFRELGTYEDPEIREFSKDLMRYLAVKDNFKFLNNSFIRLVNPDNSQLSSYSKVLKDLRVNFAKDLGGEDMFNSEFGKAIDNLYDSSWWEVLNLFKSIWYSNSGNRKFLRSFNLPADITHEGKKYIIRKFAKDPITKQRQQIIDISELPAEAKEAYKITAKFPEFFSSKQGDSLMVWKRDKRYIKKNQEIVGAIYTPLQVNQNRYQSLYHSPTFEASLKPVKLKKTQETEGEEELYNENLVDDPYADAIPAYTTEDTEDSIAPENNPELLFNFSKRNIKDISSKEVNDQNRDC